MVRDAARHSPVLHAAVTLVEQGLSTREDALTTAALALAQMYAGLHAECMGYLARLPAQPVKVGEGEGEGGA
jgi:hypothetical protein